MSNALKSYGEGHTSPIHFFLTMIGGFVYTLTSLPIVFNQHYLNGNRLIKLLPLLIAFTLLLALKLGSGNPANLYISLSEILPGFGKRVILLFGLLSGNGNCIGRAVNPFCMETAQTKPKRE